MPQIVISDIQVVSPYNICSNNEIPVFEQNDDGFVFAPLHNDWLDDLQALVSQSSHYKRVDRSVQLALLCATRMDKTKIDTGTSVFMSSSRGATGLWEKSIKMFSESGKTQVTTSPLTTLANISSEVSSYMQLGGVSLEHSLTCSSGVASILHAISWLKSGMGKSVIAGASEAPLTSFTMAQVKALGINTPFAPTEFPCRPFNAAGKNTFVLAEASGMALIKMKHNNEIVSGEIIVEAVGHAFVSPPSLTGIDNQGAALQHSMRMALANAGGPVDLILAHAPGTVKGDKAEWNAVGEVFGEISPKVYSTKWLTGHSYAASAFLNLAFAQFLFRKGALPPFPYENYSGCTPFPAQISRVLINVTGFGGNAMSLVLSVNK